VAPGDSGRRDQGSIANRMTPGAHIPEFAGPSQQRLWRLRKAMGTSKLMILVPLIDLKSPKELAACGAGTSDRRYQR